MDPTRRQVIDALVIKPDGLEVDRALAKDTYWKAFRILNGQEPVARQGINWRQDDDPILRVKQKSVVYSGQEGACTLLLTEFRRKIPVDVVDGTITVEIFSADAEGDDFRYRNGEKLFSINKEGEIDSPLELVDANIADSIVDLFLETNGQVH